MLGTATATAAYYDRIQTSAWDLGHCSLAGRRMARSRGLRTMAVRLKQHEENASQGRALAKDRVAKSGWCSTRRSPSARVTNIGDATTGVRPGLFTFELKG